jgi:hypothetical protein
MVVNLTSGRMLSYDGVEVCGEYGVRSELPKVLDC